MHYLSLDQREALRARRAVLIGLALEGVPRKPEVDEMVAYGMPRNEAIDYVEDWDADEERDRHAELMHELDGLNVVLDVLT